MLELDVELRPSAEELLELIKAFENE